MSIKASVKSSVNHQDNQTSLLGGKVTLYSTVSVESDDGRIATYDVLGYDALTDDNGNVSAVTLHVSTLTLAAMLDQNPDMTRDVTIRECWPNDREGYLTMRYAENVSVQCIVNVPATSNCAVCNASKYHDELVSYEEARKHNKYNLCHKCFSELESEVSI